MNCPNSSPISCAVIYAGKNDESVLLAMEARDGRFPAQYINTNPLYWICADGAIESPAITGPNAQADLMRLADEIEYGGLVVAELPDTQDVDLDHSRTWLLEKAANTHERPRP